MRDKSFNIEASCKVLRFPRAFYCNLLFGVPAFESTRQHRNILLAITKIRMSFHFELRFLPALDRASLRAPDDWQQNYVNFRLGFLSAENVCYFFDKKKYFWLWLWIFYSDEGRIREFVMFNDSTASQCAHNTNPRHFRRILDTSLNLFTRFARSFLKRDHIHRTESPSGGVTVNSPARVYLISFRL